MKPVYLDHAAASPLRPEVREAMAPFRDGLVGNPSSVHRWGRSARATLEEARDRTAALLGVGGREIRFVRGGTESVNLAILGRFGGSQAEGKGEPLFVRSSLEHSAVRESMDELSSRGARVETVSVAPSGEIDMPGLEALLREKPELVSFQWVNQETGIVLPIPEIAERCRAAGVLLHVDAVQAAGRVPLDLTENPIPLLSLSAHKLGGPRGMGVLLVRSGAEIRPILFGGGQEGEIRPGTEDIAGAVGTARALEVALWELEEEVDRLSELRDLLATRLKEGIERLRVHAEHAPRAPHILNVGIPELPRDLLPGALDLEGVAISAGSACRSGSTAVSPVLEALYGPSAGSVAPIRFSFGWTTTREDVEFAAETTPRVVERMRTLGVGG